MLEEPEVLAPDPDPDDAYALDIKSVQQVRQAVEEGDREQLIALMEPLHPADIADLLEQIEPGDRRRFVALYGREFDGDILSELDETIREEMIGLLSPQVLAEAVRDLDSDDVVDLLEDLDPEQRDAILGALGASDRAAVQQSLTYPEYSAGRLMQREVVMAPEHWTVGEAIDYLRASDDLPEQFYHIFLVDPKLRPVGKVALGKLMGSSRAVALRTIASDDFRIIPVLQDEGDVAYAFNQYHLISAPVVDETERLVGVITIDDAMAVLEEENEEDILRLAGVSEEASLSDTVLETLRGRATWLFVNLLTAIFASFVISLFSDTIDSMVALAVLMPIVASMGGNAGTQTMTVAVRSIATRDLTGSNALRIVRREIVVGALNGALFGFIMALVAGVWFGVPMLAVVIGSAMLLTQIAAAFGGIAIPLILERLKIDPALASGPFVTTVTDVVGFFAFLGLAAAVLL
ncbi:magnesium transporter [Citreimonas salinaria]|uniref:Magnesium transporter MgtE n=1 Tax=Citreimonas salinaria TaxID=321339 RepID=A0A1H3FX08_9RHOB|nr:magnesium transporter [Citreimonas salinaria]SDX95450.1 magnesium transporter [Citreimonas salinaria]